MTHHPTREHLRTPSAETTKTDAVTLRRKPERGDHRRDTIHAVLDEALVAHVGFVVDGQPFVIPMTYGRDGDRLYLHGSVANRTLRALDEGVPACVTVTLLDGLVLSRAHFHHSMNYRSVVLVGTARRVRDPEQRAPDGQGRDVPLPASLLDYRRPGRPSRSGPSPEG